MKVNTKKFLISVSALIITAGIAAFLALYFSPQKPVVSAKKGFTAAWKNNNSLFYLAQEDARSMGIRNLVLFPREKEEKIILNADPQRAVWACNDFVLLADPNLEYQKGHFVKLDLKTLRETPFYIPSSGRNFFFSPNCKEALIIRENSLTRYSLDEKKSTDSVELPEDLGVFDIQWYEKDKAVISVGHLELPATQKHYLLNLKDKTLKEITSFEDNYFNPEPYRDSILFTSYQGLVLYSVDKSTKQVIPPISSTSAYGVSCAWVDKNRFACLESTNKETYLYLVDLKEKRRHIMARLESEEKNYDYYEPSDLYLSPDRRKVAFRNPEGHFEIRGIRK